jgi:ATP phosphoribosyltransferase regulatory subunit
MNDRLLHTPEGLRDIHCTETSKKNELQKRIMSVFHRYGFKDVQTPTFEYIDIFNHDRGTVDIKMMYKFYDRDGNILALRPDITPSIARFVATFYNHEDTPKRICYLGNAFRNNESYQGKLREFTQAGIELIGVDSSDADAEIIAIIINSLLSTGLKNFKIDIGQAGFFTGLLEEVGLKSEHEEELRKLTDEKNYIAVEELLNSLEIAEEYKRALLDLPKLFGEVSVIEKARKMTTNIHALEALDKLEEVYKILCEYEVEKYVSFDLGMVTHLNYYTGIVFRGYTYGTGVSIVDGGRYNTLLSQFGKDTPAIGFGIEIDELMNAIERQQIDVSIDRIDTLLIYNKASRSIAIKIGEQMRMQGMNVELGLLANNIQDNISYGKRYGIGGIMNFVTDKEVELTNLETEEVVKISVDELFTE